MTETAAPRLQATGICKAFPGVRALDEVGLEVRAGEIHALVGENGAGKSTLMHIISGVYRPDQGSMWLDGQAYSPADEKDAQEAGVAIVFQEGSLFPPLSIAENIFAGRQPTTDFGTIRFAGMRQETQRLLAELDAPLNPDTKVADLSPGQRQLVEIAKALSHQVRVLILDEPTSSLTISEARHLFMIVRRMAQAGVAIIFVTHRLGEVFETADRVTVLKDGRYMGTRVIRDTTADELIQLEVGRELTFARDDHRPAVDAPVVLAVRDLHADPVVSATLDVRAGEIVCLAGLVGAGRTELCEAIFGARPRQSGRVELLGNTLDARHPLDAMQAGIGMVPEDRRDAGLFLAMGVSHNILAGNMASVSRAGVLDFKAIETLAQRYIGSLRIATPSSDREVVFLSGGNQQKVLLARWLERAPRLLIVDEPTRGVDVGAKAEVYAILRQLARSGVALLVVSSDLPEVLALAHRIVVMSEGCTVGELDAAQADEVAVLQLAMPKGMLNREG